MRDKVKIRLFAVICVAGLTAAFGARAMAPEREGRVVSGQVVDAGSHEVLDGVRVVVKGTGLSGRTSEDGTFSIEKVPGEKVALEMSRAGYKSREVDILVTATPTKWTVALWKAR